MIKRRQIGGCIIIGLGVLMAIRSGRTIIGLLQAGGPLTEARQELVEVEVENQKLRKRLADVESPLFVEQEARNKLGYGREGEVILVLPKDAEAGPSGQTQASEEKKPHWKQWWDLYIKI